MSPRKGSGSEDFYDPKLAPLGPIHHGRRPPEEQPSRAELRDFHRRAAPLLNFETIWFDDAKRQVVADAFREVVCEERYTVYACAILSNHAHLVIRRHRDDALTMLTRLADASRLRLRPRKMTIDPSTRSGPSARTRCSSTHPKMSAGASTTSGRIP
jgi:hypothetical protein